MMGEDKLKIYFDIVLGLDRMVLCSLANNPGLAAKRRKLIKKPSLQHSKGTSSSFPGKY